MFRNTRALTLFSALSTLSTLSTLVACGATESPGTGGSGGATTTSTSSTTSVTTSMTTSSTSSSTSSTSSTTTTSASTSSTSSSIGGGGTGGTGGAGTGGSVCGDGIAASSEVCDDGNTMAGDGCSPTCAFEATCGNGMIEPGESCDDGNAMPNDGCSATCKVEAGDVCGDSIDLNDPAKVTVTGRVTAYQGTTLGAGNTALGAPSCSSGAAGVPRVVHRYRTGGAPSVLHIETVDTNGPLLDSVLWAVLDCQHPTEVACGEDGTSGLLASVDTAWLPAGSTVFIVVAGYSDLDVGAYDLRITETPATFEPTSGTCAMPTSIGEGTFAGATLSTDAHGGSLATACIADAPDAVYVVDVEKTADLRVSATTNSTAFDLVLSLVGMSCGTGPEITCADAQGAGVGESIAVNDLAAGTYYVVVGGYSAVDVGPYALHVDLIDILAAGAACNAASTTARCANGTICHAGVCEAPKDLLVADFSVDLAPFTIGDAGGDGQSFGYCDPAGGCAWDNTTGASPTDPYALVRDVQGTALDGETITSPALDAAGLAQVFVAFDHAFDHAPAAADLGAVEVSTDGLAWTPVATYTSDAQGHVTIDVSSIAAGHGAFYVRFRYDDQTNAAADPFADGWRIDDVHVFGF